MQGKLSLLIDAGALLVSKAALIGLRLLTLYLCAASIGRSEFGPLALSFTIAEISRFIGDWGGDTLSLRRFSDPDEAVAKACLIWFRRLRVLSSAVAFLCALSGIVFISGVGISASAFLIALTSVTSLWMNLGVNWLQARGKLRACVIPLVVLGGLASAGQLLAAHLAVEVFHRLLALLLSEVVLCVCILWLVGFRLSSVVKLETRFRAVWFADATPIALAALIALGYGKIDQFYIKYIGGVSILGDYSLANRMVEPFLFIAAALSSTIYARASALVLSEGVGPGLIAAVMKWLKAMACYAALVATGVGVLSIIVIPRVFPDYAGALVFIGIGLAALMFRSLNLCLTAFIQATGAYKAILKINILNCMLIMTTVVAMGHFIGPVGAALAVAIGELINTAIQTFTLKKRILGKR